jgi:recombination protein RecT
VSNNNTKPPSGGQQELGAAKPQPPAQPASKALATTEQPGEIKRLDPRQEIKSGGTLMSFLSANSAVIEQFAMGFMKPDAMFRLATMALSRNPELQKCTLASMLRCMIEAAVVRIRPGGQNGRGYIVPRKNNKANPPVWEAHFDPGWRGLCDLARRSGTIKAIGAEAIRVGDEFDFYYDPLPKLKFRRMRGGTEDREIIGAFAVASLADGALQIEVIEKEDLEKIMNASAAKSGPWSDWKSEMARKSAVKCLCKYLPIPDDYEALGHGMALSDGADTGQRILDVRGETVPDGPSQNDRIRGQLEAPSASAWDQLTELEGDAAAVLTSAEGA